MHEQPNGRTVLKFVVKSIVANGVAHLSVRVITDYTSLERTNNFRVTLPSSILGWYVANRVSPVTDKIVDKVADFYVLQRVKRQSKKASKSK